MVFVTLSFLSKPICKNREDYFGKASNGFFSSNKKTRLWIYLTLSILLGNSPLATCTELVNGGKISAAISVPGEQDSYTFNSNAGETVRIRVADIDRVSGFHPRIDIFDPNGSLRSTRHDETVADMRYTAEINGTYTVLISDYYFNFGFPNGTGHYDLYFEHMPGANKNGTLTNGGAVSETIDLGEFDSYTFTANAGDTLLIRAADMDGSGLYPALELYDPDGSLYDQRNGENVAAIRKSANKTGLFTVLVFDQFSRDDAIGNYRLYFTQVPGANEGGLLINGGIVTDSIDLGDIDSYTFTVNAGDKGEVRVTDIDNSRFSPTLELFRPNGLVQIENETSHSGAFASLHFSSLEQTGTYTVVIHDGSIGNDAAGNYTIALTKENDFFSYAALGDSFSSGEGVYPYFDTLNPLPFFDNCHRSTRAYSTLIRIPGQVVPIAEQNNAQFDFFACTGAETKNIPANGEARFGEPPQLASKNGVNGSRDLVTMSIGGNDAYFIWIVGFCFAHDSCNTIKPFAPYLDVELGELFPLWMPVVKERLLRVYTELRNATPNATTLILDYPILMSGHECDAVKVPGHEEFKLSESEQTFMRDANQRVNTVVKEAAAEIGLHYVPVANHFTNHEICGTLDDWINGLVLYNPSALFHPTSRGQYEYARVANAYLESKKTGWPYGYFATGLPRNPEPLVAAISQANVAVATTTLPEFGELDVSFASAPIGCEASRDVIVPGSPALIQGKGFAASETINLSLAIPGEQPIALGTASSDESGILNTTMSIPANVPVGSMGTVEALAAGPTGVGRLLLSIVRIEDSITLDSDGDGIPNACDNCPNNANPEQTDSDGDGRGDACDLCPTEFPDDEDGDGLCRSVDLCPLDPDNDADGDGICATEDNCPITPNPDQSDTDGNGIGDACSNLACYPVNLSVNSSVNGNIATSPANCGLDSYFQGTQLTLNAQPTPGNFFTGWTGDVTSTSNPLNLSVTSAKTLKANFCSDTADNDGDLVANSCDNCTLVSNPSQADTDGDKIGNACDADLNNDNIVNSLDLGLFKKCYLKSAPDAQCPHPENADFNDDGKVNSLDLGLFKKMYLKSPGPSGMIN